MTTYNIMYTSAYKLIKFPNVVSKCIILYLVVGVITLGLTGCSSSQPVKAEPPDADIVWGAEDNAIVLKFKASKDLNMDRGQPSSLSICLYQLSDSRTFDQLRLQGPEGLAALASCENFGSAVVAYQRLFLEPGQHLETYINRWEGTKFVGVAAGYYTLESNRCARIIPVPIVKISDGWFSSHREAGQLIVNLNFGPDWPQTP